MLKATNNYGGTLYPDLIYTTLRIIFPLIVSLVPPTYADPGVQIVEEGQDITVTLTVLESRPTDLTVGTLTRAGGASVPGDTAFNTVCVTFIDVQCGDAGQYTLTSSNVAGAGSVTFTLDVQRK